MREAAEGKGRDRHVGRAFDRQLMMAIAAMVGVGFCWDRSRRSARGAGSPLRRCGPRAGRDPGRHQLPGGRADRPKGSLMTDCRRDRLPNRRLQSTEVVEWQGQEWLMSVGFDQSGQVREAFVKGLKTGSAMDAIMGDACVLLSLLLQAGYSASDVDSHLGREGVDSFAPAASPLGFWPRRQPWNVKSATAFAPSMTFPP